MGGRTLLTLSASVVSTAGFGGAPVEFGIDFGGVAIVRDTRQMVMILAWQIDVVRGRKWKCDKVDKSREMHQIPCLMSLPGGKYLELAIVIAQPGWCRLQLPQVGAGYEPIFVVPRLRMQRAPIERFCSKFLFQPPIARAHSIRFSGTVYCVLISDRTRQHDVVGVVVIGEVIVRIIGFDSKPSSAAVGGTSSSFARMSTRRYRDRSMTTAVSSMS